MSVDFFKNVLLFAIMTIAQVLVFNHIHLFGCAVPLLYVYFILRFNRYYPRWATLLWAFLLGLSVDMFSNTPGLAAASMTLVALLQPYMMSVFIAHDNKDDVKPTLRSLGPGKYVTYALICVFTFCLTFFTLEAFSFFNWLQWIANILGSTALTLALIIVLENVRRD